jgi:hypothetical protein
LLCGAPSRPLVPQLHPKSVVTVELFVAKVVEVNFVVRIADVNG